MFRSRQIEPLGGECWPPFSPDVSLYFLTEGNLASHKSYVCSLEVLINGRQVTSIWLLNYCSLSGGLHSESLLSSHVSIYRNMFIFSFGTVSAAPIVPDVQKWTGGHVNRENKMATKISSCGMFRSCALCLFRPLHMNTQKAAQRTIVRGKQLVGQHCQGTKVFHHIPEQ